MADEQIPFNSLDPLGPEYGRGDLPVIDTKGLQPFEGDRIEDPKINFPEQQIPRYYPVTPIKQPIHPYHTTRKVVGQPPQRNTVKGPIDINALHNSIASGMKGSMVANQSKGTYGGVYNYNAGPTGNAYYKKYHAYGQETFDKIGFTPFQDNESLFTANTGAWDDFKRTMTHTFVPLAWEGFKSGPKSLVKMLQGDFTSVDDEGAKMYEELAAIGQSSRGGLFGFFNNTLVASAYTAGILSEAILEEIAGVALAGPTGGSSAVATTANNINKLKRIPGIFKSMDRAVDGMKAMKNSLNTLDNINDTRSFWNRTKSTLNSFGKNILPFENTLDAVGQIVRNEDNLTGLARTHFALGKTAGGLYRDVKGVNMALAESRLEGAFAKNETYDKLYSDFYEANKRRPTNEEQKLLYARAEEAGTTALGFNSALIYASNKIMFPSLLSPRGGINRWLTSKTRDILDLKAGKIVFEGAKKGTQTAVKGKAMKGTFKYVENSLMNSVKGLIKDPKRAIPATLGYFKANFTEGIQENLQDVIAQATKNYYTDAYKDPKLANFHYAKGLFHSALNDQFTAKGFETFASGFAMGLFASPVNKSVQLLSYGKARLFNNQKYQEYVQAKEKIGTKMVNDLNAMGSDPTAFFNSRITNFATQSRANTIIKNGDTKEVNDAKSESFISQLTSAFETDTLDYFKEHLSSFKQYTPEEFEEAFGFEKGTGAEYQSRIDDILKHADGMQKTYKGLNEKYKDTINLDDYKKGSDTYNRAAIYKMALRESKKNAVFFKHTFDDTRSRMSDIGNTLLGEMPLQNMSTSEMQALFEPARMKSELDMLRNESEILKQSDKADDKAKAEKIDRKIEAMQNFSNVLKYRDTHYSTDPADKIKSDFIDKLTDEEKESITEEELDQLIDEELAAAGRVRRSDETDLKVDMMLEKVYKDYLKSIADVSDDTYFDEAADNAFSKLLDYYNLNNESRIMSKYVNFLNNPGDFAGLVDRHYDWMTELWENRKDYYKEQIQQSMNAFADNALLNQLADENFYVSLEDFERWQQTGEVPNEFFNDQKNIVVREGNEDYDRFEKIFNMAYLARQAGILDENLNYDEELKKELADLDAQKREEIEALPKSEVITELEKIEPAKKGKVTSKDIVDQVQPGESIDITYKTKDGEDTLTITRDEEGFKTENGEVFNIDSLQLDITDTRRYLVETKPDPAAEQEINDRYKNKRADIINKYAEKKAEAAEAEEVTSTPEKSAVKKEAPVVEATDEFSAMPKELQDQLQAEYQKYLENNPALFEESADWSDEEYLNSLRSFVRTNGVARRIISDYNQKSKLEAATETTGEVEKLIVKISGKEVDLTDATEAEINRNRKLLMLQINNLSTKDKRTPDENLTLAESKADKAKIDRFLKAKGTKTVTPKMQEAIDRLNLVFEAQKRLVKQNEGYYVDGKLMERVTRAIESLGLTEYSYSDETKVLASINQTLLKGKSVDEFIADLRKKSPSGFSEYTYTELQRELTRILAEAPVSTVSTEKITSEIKPENLKLNVKSTTDGLIDVASENKDLSEIDELAYSKKMPDNYKNSFLVENNELKIRIPAMDFKGRTGGHTLINLTVPAGFNEEIFSEKLASIKHRGDATTKTTVPEVLEKVRNAISESIVTTDTTKQQLTSQQLDSLKEDLKVEEGEFGNPERAKEIRDQINKLEKQTPKRKVKLTDQEIIDEVMGLVKEKTYEDSRIAGNYVDNQIKNVFDPKVGKPEFDETKITQEAFDALFGPDGIITELKKKADANEIKVFTQDIRVFDTDAGIAGEIDIIIVDREGNVKIVDVKTGEASKWNNFQAKDKFGYQKQLHYILQQTAYSNLLFNMTGLDSSIGILPIQITKDSETGKVLTATSPKVASGLLPGNYEIPLNKAIYQKEIDSLIPRKGVLTESENKLTANLESIQRETADDEVSPAVVAQEKLEDKLVGEGKGDPELVNNLRARIKIAKNKESINKIKDSIKRNLKKLNASEVTELSNALQEKLDSLSEGTLKLNKENLKENDQLIVKYAIFINKGKWAIEGNTLVITSVNDNGVTVRKARGKKTENLTFAQVNGLTVLKSNLDEMKSVEEKQLTKKEQSVITESKNNLDSFIKNFDQLDDVETEADASDIKELEEKLFNQNICE